VRSEKTTFLWRKEKGKDGQKSVKKKGLNVWELGSQKENGERIGGRWTVKEDKPPHYDTRNGVPAEKNERKTLVNQA